MNWIKSRPLLIAVLLGVCFHQCWALRPSQIVETHLGPVQGEILSTVWEAKEYSVFKGIPFAAPPIGPLRFKPPVEAAPWKSVLTTVKDGNMCTQSGSGPRNVAGSEDCLYLNVFTPHVNLKNPKNIEKKPVMVWIYGGGFHAGSSNSSLYGPDFFLNNDVVFVSFNYRLGALGFLSADHPDALGNCGLKDQSFALKWVQRNIANFGGDPNRVTIFGQSAGSASVQLQVLSEMSKGLFNQAISMSGSPLSPWSYYNPKEALANAFKLAKELGHTTTDKDSLLKFLHTVPADDIVIATKAITKLPMIYAFTPTTENAQLGNPGEHFITKCPIRKLHSGNFTKIPHMLGFTKDELLGFALPTEENEKMMKNTESMLLETARIINPTAAEQKKWIAETLKILSESTDRRTDQIISATQFDGPIDLTQKFLAGNNNGYPVFYYRVSYETDYAIHKIVSGIDLDGTAHSDDVGFIFNIKDYNVPTDPKDPFNQFRQRMVRLWTNFAKYGNPTPENDQSLNVLWPDSGSEGWQMDIDEEFVVKPRMVTTGTEIFEILWYIANPIIYGCNAPLSPFFNDV